MATAVDVKDIVLSDLLKQKYIQLNIESKEKDKLLAEMAAIICSSGKVKNKKALLSALLERETLGSTGIGSGVAIPHAKIDGVKEPMLAFGRSLEGVDFNSLDGEMAYLFFVLISPKEEVGKHLKILAKISHIIKDKFTVGQLKKAKTASDVLKVLIAAEEHLNI
ncbi:MAG: PTS sugar transporter subunit IIA [Candidatus Omnitrophota bacterium]